MSGLPNGTNAAIQLTDPTGANYTVTGSLRVVPAMAGRWRQTASPVNTGAALYTPSRSARDTSVSPGDTLPFGIAYTLTTGSLAVAVTGLPGGTSADVTVTGPGGYTRLLTATTTLVLLTPGTYTLTAAPVTTGSGTFSASPSSQNVTVTASPVATGATVTYSLPAGAIAIAASGYPAGTTPVFTLTGPGASRIQNGPGMVSGLTVGTWTVTAASVTSGATTDRPTPPSATVSVVAVVVVVVG